MRFTRHAANVTLALAALGLGGGAQAATVFARTEIIPANPYFDVLSSNQVNTPAFSLADLVTTIGFAQATTRTTTGTLSGLAHVSLANTTPGRGGSLRAYGGGSLAEAMTVSDSYCLAGICTKASDLGIDRIDYTVFIRASGTTSAFNNSVNGSASSQSRVSYNWSIGGASGGGDRLRFSDGTTLGEISSANPTFRTAPGSSLTLLMGFGIDASAGIAPPNEQNTGPVGIALSDFTHTLQWGGVQSVRAYGAGGQEIELASGGRFSMIGANGFDYWDAAPGFAAGVPEPNVWGLLILGFGTVGAGMRTRRRAVFAQA